MSLSYGITFLCNCCRKLIIHWKVLYDIFLLKTCKVVIEVLIASETDEKGLLVSAVMFIEIPMMY